MRMLRSYFRQALRKRATEARVFSYFLSFRKQALKAPRQKSVCLKNYLQFHKTPCRPKQAERPNCK